MLVAVVAVAFFAGFLTTLLVVGLCITAAAGDRVPPARATSPAGRGMPAAGNEPMPVPGAGRHIRILHDTDGAA